MYPDSGSPAIVVDATLSPEAAATVWTESLAAEYSWDAFYKRMYRE
jgi:hypothetical protein